LIAKVLLNDNKGKDGEKNRTEPSQGIFKLRLFLLDEVSEGDSKEVK